MRLVILAACVAATAMPATAQMMRRDPAQIFDQADANHDGRISRDEFIVARSAAFSRMDRNGDGVISRDDFAQIMRLRPQAGQRIDAMIAKADANRDGKVTAAELAAAPTTIFDRADTNHDGFVDRAELAALRTRLPLMKQGN